MAHLPRQQPSQPRRPNPNGRSLPTQLPKITTKLQEANAFLANPLRLSTPTARNTEVEGEDHHPEVGRGETWLEEQEESATTRKERAIKLQISDLVGSREGTEAWEMSAERVIAKMRKYQPTNSSFSLLYGEKRMAEERSGEEVSETRRRKLLNLPSLDLRRHPLSRQEAELRAQELSSSRQQRSPRQGNNLGGYLSKIKEIYREGSALHHRSEGLINRIDKVSLFLERRFDRFDSQAESMLADVGSYHLEEETSGEYKQQLMDNLLHKLRR